MLDAEILAVGRMVVPSKPVILMLKNMVHMPAPTNSLLKFIFTLGAIFH